MLKGKVFERFAQASPTTVMVRALMEQALSAERLNKLFATHAVKQRVGETLFSTLVDLMSLVVLRDRPSMHAAYQLRMEEITVAVQSIYNKLDGLEPQVSEALVRETAASFLEVLACLGGQLPEPLPGYHSLILDGNHLAGTEHRVKELRTTNAAALPGQVLALLDPTTKMLVDVICEEDAHANERTLLPRLYEQLRAGDVLIADRNFATFKNVRELSQRGIHFIIRQHLANFPVEELDKPKHRGRVPGGELYEQRVRFCVNGYVWEGRRITVRLKEPNRFGEVEVHLITDLPSSVAARAISQAYRTRWSIEACFGHMAVTLRCEINTLGYPKAALFGFCTGMLMYNLLNTIQGVLRSAHGAEKINRECSLFYLAEETSSVYHGMLIALPPASWKRAYGEMTTEEIAKALSELAATVELSRFRKHTRAPKLPPPPRTSGNRGNHVATAQLLAKRSAVS